MASQRRALIPLLVLALAAWTTYHLAFVAGGAPTAGLRGVAATRGLARTSLLARGGEDASDDSVELGGFSSFVVGLALLPYVLYALNTAFQVGIGSAPFELGPYGIELVSICVTVGLTLWSLGSFVQRGRGLPAGPLGFLGLSEGLSYLAALGLVIATAAAGFRSGGMPSLPKVSAPTMPAFEAPSMLKNSAPQLKSIDLPKFEAPKFEAPKIEVPKFEAPKMPEIKAPKIDIPKIEAPKIPDIKVPEIKAPEIKVPEVKVPEIKAPEVKKVEPKKAPEPEKPKEAPKPPAPKPAPAKPAPSGPDYDMLFD